MKMHILVVEDDQEINRLLGATIEKLGHTYTPAFSGTEAILNINSRNFDLILLDLMIPGIDGKEVLREIRKESMVPVIIISAKSEVEDKVELLRTGADDYVTKPFANDEIAARIEVQLRRSESISSASSPDIVEFKDLKVNQESRKVELSGSIIDLTNAEFDILLLLIKRPGHAFSKSEIYSSIWSGPYLGDDNTISVHISNIRKKIAKITDEEYIKTVWGIGFMV